MKYLFFILTILICFACDTKESLNLTFANSYSKVTTDNYSFSMSDSGDKLSVEGSGLPTNGSLSVLLITPENDTIYTLNIAEGDDISASKQFSRSEGNWKMVVKSQVNEDLSCNGSYSFKVKY